MLAVLLVAGRLGGRSLQSGELAAPDRAAPPPTAAQAPPPRALPRTLPVVAGIPLPSRSGLQQGWHDDEHAVAAASEAVWVADGCAVARIDPRSNRITARVAIRERDPQGNPCRVLGLSISPSGHVWVATTTVLLRIDRAGRRGAATLPVAPSGAPAAAAGAIWVACCWVVESEHASLPLQGWLLRVDPGTDRVTARIPLPGGHPKAVGAGQGAIWVAGYRDRQARPGDVIEHSPVIWQVDPHQHRFIGSATVIQGGPLVAAAGVVWAAGASSLAPLTGPHAGGDGPHLGRHLLDPFGRRITGLAASGDALWVAASDALYRIDPHTLG